MPLRRLLFSLFVAATAVTLGFAVYQAAAELHSLREEVERQAMELAASQRDAAIRAIQSGSPEQAQSFVNQFHKRDRLIGVAALDTSGATIAATAGSNLPAARVRALARQANSSNKTRGAFFRESGAPMHALAMPLQAEGRALGVMVVVHSVAYATAPVWRHAMVSGAQTLLVLALAFLIVRWSLTKPMQRITQWLRDLHSEAATPTAAVPKAPFLDPLTSEIARLAMSLRAARAAANEEARLRDTAQSLWTAEMLRVSVQSKLEGSRLFAVSNREPYEHSAQNGETTWRVPPSGLVTALEPILRACNGTWIAQATGAADRETADANGRLRVPPDNPQYTLRRVWLSKEEDQGFYLGFANEGLWPLCHIAHTRPVFRASDWEQYRAVNEKFAAALLEEMQGDERPLVLAQDYHFALLPRMIKERRPDARVAIFWHIPWPNSEAFRICPWQRELLDGMLGADLIGFHIQAHCNNFLETVDRTLESRIDWEHFAVNRQEHLTAVRPFPISVAFNGASGDSPERCREDRAAIFRQLGIEGYMGIGVDRVDYTKGIPERFRGIERLLEIHPEYERRLTFVQIGAPSRSSIRSYQNLMAEVEEEAERINRRFRSGSWRPIVFLNQHHNHEQIQRYYHAADFCLVTSLHDGMNLVAKEYIAARADNQGALILSRFTGASHELPDALMVNPYDTGEVAGAIHAAISMPSTERVARMERMRAVIREHNVYRWAGNLIFQLAGVRLEASASAGTTGAGKAVAR